MTLKLHNTFDSHVHWLETGKRESQLLLHDLKSPEDVKNLKLKKEHFRDSWLLGSGWDDHLWPKNSLITRQLLDEIYEGPVCFYRADSHAMWLNTKALQEVGLFQKNISQIHDLQKGKIFEDHDGWPTGLIVEGVFQLIEEKIPYISKQEVRESLLKGMQVFHKAGFTHIRDFISHPLQWEEVMKLDEEKKLKLAVECFFYAQNDFQKGVNQALQAQKHTSSLLRPQGVKIFLDGALGSQGAYLSEAYKNSSDDERGFCLFSPSELKERLEMAFHHNLEVAVHCIGDEASHQLALVSQKLKIKGKIHIEHAELLRDETIQILKEQNITAHIQPCHGLTDFKFLSDRLNHYDFVFRWQELEKQGVEFYFGSDTPVEPPSLFNTKQSLTHSESYKIPPLLKNWYHYHEHRDRNWISNAYTEISNNKVIKTVFQNEVVHCDESQPYEVAPK